MDNTLEKVQAAVAIIEISQPRREVLILRRVACKDDPWSAQYSFPGGRCEEEDTSALATAIRETKEEAGIVLSRQVLVQELAPTFAARSGINPLLVQPFHFMLSQRPSLTLNSNEMQAAHWLDLEAFLHPKGHLMRDMLPDRLPGQLYPAWPVDGYFLWGFTYELVQKVFGGSKESREIK